MSTGIQLQLLPSGQLVVAAKPCLLVALILHQCLGFRQLLLNPTSTTHWVLLHHCCHVTTSAQGAVHIHLCGSAAIQGRHEAVVTHVVFDTQRVTRTQHVCCNRQTCRGNHVLHTDVGQAECWLAVSVSATARWH